MKAVSSTSFAKTHKKCLWGFAFCKNRCILADKIFRGSSMVEHATVNRRVAGSSPARGARKKAAHIIRCAAFFVFIPTMRHLYCKSPIG